MSTQQITRILTITAAVAGLVAGFPGPASAQRVKVDVKISEDIGREIRAALREVSTGIRDLSSGINDAMREVSREINRELGRELPRTLSLNLDISRGISRDLNRDIGRDISRGISRDLNRDIGRDISRGIAEGLRELPKLGVWDGAWRDLKLGAWRDLELGAWRDLELGAWNDVQERNWRGESIDRQTRPLAIGANGTIDLHNISGDITINAGRGNDASIELIRRSRGRTDADAKTGLDRVKTDVQVAGTRATVKTEYTQERQSNYSVSVDMIVTAPAGTRVVVNSISGDVRVTGVRGELSISTISGDVVLTNVGAVSEAKTASGDVTIMGATSDGTIEAGTLSGDVLLQQVKARRCIGSTVSGSVTARDVTCGSATLSTMSGDTIFSGELSPNGRYELTSHSGDVRFTPAGSVGFTLSANTFGGDINSSISLQSTTNGRTRRRSLSGKVGDGSATVTLQTFNGDITIGGVRR